MKILLEKISSYNIFNYLLPGIIFVILAEKMTTFSFIQENILLGLFFYYFIGLIISRIGSLTIEPVFKKIKIIHFADYKDFIASSQKNNKIELLSEINNMYRTLCSLFLVIIAIKIYERLVNELTMIRNWTIEIVIIGLFILFMLSYRKQTQYTTKLIQTILKKG
jgi:hypothetical protein